MKKALKSFRWFWLWPWLSPFRPLSGSKAPVTQVLFGALVYTDLGGWNRDADNPNHFPGQTEGSNCFNHARHSGSAGCESGAVGATGTPLGCHNRVSRWRRWFLVMVVLIGRAPNLAGITSLGTTFPAGKTDGHIML
jgi:hypothetical protein